LRAGARLSLNSMTGMLSDQYKSTHPIIVFCYKRRTSTSL